MGSIPIAQLYAGIIPKLFFNIPFATALYSTTQNDENSWAYWLATAIAFPLNTRKVWAQTNELKPTFTFSYRGVLPFMLLNYLFAWKLTALTSSENQKILYANSL